MALDNPEYEWARDRIPDTSPVPGQLLRDELVKEAGDMMREGLNAIDEACGGNPVRESILRARMAGKPYAYIGARYGISKQAIAKHVGEIIKRRPCMRDLLSGQCGRRIESLASTMELDSFILETETKLRSSTQWIKRKN